MFPPLLQSQQAGEVFQILAQLLLELGGGSAVHSPMVVGQAQAHGGVDLDAAVLAFTDTVGSTANTQNAGLGRIDNGSEAFHTHVAQIGHGEAATGQLVGDDSAVTAFSGQLLNSLGDLQQAHGVGSEDGGNHQATVNINIKFLRFYCYIFFYIAFENEYL